MKDRLKDLCYELQSASSNWDHKLSLYDLIISNDKYLDYKLLLVPKILKNQKDTRIYSYELYIPDYKKDNHFTVINLYELEYTSDTYTVESIHEFYNDETILKGTPLEIMEIAYNLFHVAKNIELLELSLARIHEYSYDCVDMIIGNGHLH